MKSKNQIKGNLIALICVGTTILALVGLALSVNDYQIASRYLFVESDVEDSLESFRQQKLDQQKTQCRQQRIKDKLKRFRKKRSTKRTSTETELKESADWWEETFEQAFDKITHEAEREFNEIFKTGEWNDGDHPRIQDVMFQILMRLQSTTSNLDVDEIKGEMIREFSKIFNAGALDEGEERRVGAVLTKMFRGFSRISKLSV